MSDEEDREREDVAREIHAYLLEHREGGDTLEGIARWWLLRRRITQQVSLVEKALADLESKGLVRKRAYTSEQVYLAVTDRTSASGSSQKEQD